MKLKEVEMYRAVMEALEALDQEIRKVDFYTKAAEDSLERLQGTLTRAQRMEVDRLDHSIQVLRGLAATALRALDVAIKAAMARQAIPPRRDRTRGSL